MVVTCLLEKSFLHRFGRLSQHHLMEWRSQTGRNSGIWDVAVTGSADVHDVLLGLVDLPAPWRE